MTDLDDDLKNMPEPYRSKHEESSHHRAEIEASKTVGCFYCLELYSPDQIIEWIDDDQTALCPKCGIDSVLPNLGWPGSKKFLGNMRKYWFAGAPSILK